MSCESFGEFRFNLGRLLQGQRMVYHFLMALTHLLSVLEVLNVILAYWKSCLVNLLVILNSTLGAFFLVKGGTVTFRWP